ncbi:hypothetical protein FACS1894172_04930 [Spirochaetia bacterium]|nr:hypothetical protein FACS1894172_04930 [Spirochaetia bacterium]
MGMYDRTLIGNRRVGDGKGNTDKFNAEFQKRGGGVNTAPGICSELIINDFDDWYLPSTDELLYMYNNLYMNGLGDLKKSVYWSSTVGLELYCIDFVDGSEKDPLAYNQDTVKHQVRAVRQF